jgi:bifunctional N-acetylglucosamine-1-phosphate-uridyltransferase/glucosamine-1-phosphate-acetyltransferase GlmU-like protein
MSSYVFEASDLAQTLGKLTNENHQREYYITDSPGILKAAGKQVTAWAVLEPCEALSINSVDELAVVEAEMQALGYANPSL